MREGYTKKKLPDVLWFQEGPGVRKHQYVNEGIKLLNVANLVNGKIDLSTSNRYITKEEAYGKYKHFLADEGDGVCTKGTFTSLHEYKHNPFQDIR